MNEVEFNPQFVSRMIPKLEWGVLVQAADWVSSVKTEIMILNTTSVYSAIRNEMFQIWAKQMRKNCGDINTLCGNVREIKNMLSTFGLQLGQREDLPAELVSDYEKNDDFLKKVHRVLLEVKGLLRGFICAYYCSA